MLLQNNWYANAQDSLVKGRVEFPQLIEKVYGEIWFTGVTERPLAGDDAFIAHLLGILQVALSLKGQYSLFISVHFALFLQLSVFKWLRITCLSFTCQLRNVTYFRLPSPESSSDMRSAFNSQALCAVPSRVL